MLVLSRKPGERILVGNDVVITIVRIGPNTVRLGIDAPSHLNIVREELCDPGSAEVASGNSTATGTPVASPPPQPVPPQQRILPR